MFICINNVLSSQILPFLTNYSYYQLWVSRCPFSLLSTIFDSYSNLLLSTPIFSYKFNFQLWKPECDKRILPFNFPNFQNSSSSLNGSTKKHAHIYTYIYIFTRLKTETPYKRDIPEDSSGQGKRVSKDRASKRSEIEGTKLFQPAANALSESSTRPLWVKKKKEKFFFWKLQLFDSPDTAFDLPSLFHPCPARLKRR